MAHNKKQLEAQIMTVISDVILEEIDNPAFETLAITEVRLNGDNSIATVFVNFMKNEKELIHELRTAGAFIRREMASRVSIRKIPFFEFEIDTLLEGINHIESVIEKTK